MDILSLSERGQGPKRIPLWLHRDHGHQVSQLEALRVPATDGQVSTAQAFAAAASASSHVAEPLGLPCCVEGLQLCLEMGDQQENHLVTPLFLADVSCAPLPSSPDLVVMAFVPPSAGSGLSGTSGWSSGEGEASAATGWFVLSRGVQSCHDILDALSNLGCLRGDLEEAFSPSTDGDGIIGEGAYATVQSMRCRDGTAVAVKKMNATVELDAIEREVATLLNVQQHEHIVGYRGIFWFRELEVVRLAVVFDVAPCGDLLYKVLKHGTMTEGTARRLFSGIMSGLEYIHAHNIVHRDIKAENVLLKHEDTAIVADFGLATWVTDEVQMARRCGSPGYVAPEVCLGTPYSFKVDVFGAGIVLYFMLSKEMPFSSPDRDTAATMRRTVKCSLHLHRPPWDSMSSRLRNVLRQMICKNADERLSAAATMEHPWMQMTGEKHRSSGNHTSSRGETSAQNPATPATGYPEGLQGWEVPAGQQPVYASAPSPAPVDYPRGTFEFGNDDGADVNDGK
eukprot:CAMPEP_0171262590 /NCGR_PEP_ID=MMETSP0790-20130122/56641_1 /TAXON_ID=2925 /ORGANISM="Alexandrium catenella, Strain OF101" /LENGTH=509 /DNA_ID=CAMNT_0011731139 /DNA_START=33 /DNA_END=1562 /DNA_ORIENTATION=+